MKQLTGGDSIRARRMREDFWQFQPSHTVILATNHKPGILGTDYGIWRRIRLVPFTVVIPEAEQDKNLANKLRSEWPLILRWAVEGCLEWQRNGLQAPQEVLCATDTYRADMDVLGEFIAECCFVGPDRTATAGALYQRYRTWANERGELPATQTHFGAQLAERGYAKVRGTRGAEQGRIQYQGLEIALGV